MIQNVNGHILGFNGVGVANTCCCGTTTTTPALATCNCTAGNEGDPRVNVTLTFTGGGTKSFLGCDFTSGVTQAICPGFYQCTPTGGASADELWDLAGGGDYLALRDATVGTTFLYAQVQLSRGTEYFFLRKITTATSFTTSNGNIKTTLTPSANQLIPGAPVNDVSFGSVVLGDGTVISWERGAGSWGC